MNPAKTTLKTSSISKKLANEERAKKLLANLGMVSARTISRVFRPQDEIWHHNVLTRTKRYLAWIYTHSERAKKQANPSSKLLDELGPHGKITETEEKNLIKRSTPLKLSPSEKRSFIDFQTGMKPWKSEKEIAKNRMVLAAHWMRCWGIAALIEDRSAIVMVNRLVKSLLETKEIKEKKMPNGTWFYWLAEDRNPEIQAERIKARSPGQVTSVHRTLANGYLLSALSTAEEGWSEPSMYSENLYPGIKGGPGFFHHRELFEGLTGATSGKMHPADGVLAYKKESKSSQESWALELIEAENASKSIEDYITTLMPLTYGMRQESYYEKAYIRKKDTITRRFKVEKLTFVIASEEFLKRILRACRQFISGETLSRTGEWEVTKRPIFKGESESIPGKWEELLRMIQVVYCPMSATMTTFTGVSRVFNLWEYAKNNELSTPNQEL